MQYSYIPYLLKQQSAQWMWKILQAVILIALLFYVYAKLSDEGNFGHEFWLQAGQMFRQHAFYMLLLPVFLMPVNWALESWKWKLLLKKSYPLAFWNAFQGVLSGLSVGLISHRMAGDAFGRLGFLPSGYRKKAAGPMLISQISQTFASYFFGSFGLIYLLTHQQNTYQQWAVGLPFVLALSLSLVFLFLKSISKQNYQSKGLRYFSDWLAGIRLYSFYEFAGASLLAVVRYLVFTFQMMWVLYLAGVSLDWFTLFAGVSCIFLAKTILPSMGFLAELGIRSGSALFFFGQFGVDESAVILGSLWIWLINVMIPALVGGLMIWRFKPVTKQKVWS